MTAVETTINEAFVPEFFKKLEKLNRRAVKLGGSLVTAEVVELFEHVSGAGASKPVGGYRKVVDGVSRWAAMHARIVVTGEAPKCEGYSFIATVDMRGENPVVRANPGAEGVDLTPFWSTDHHCDHCKSMRMRNDVLVLRNDTTGELIQIGRNCAADFFRSKNALALLDSGWWSLSSGYSNDDEGGWPSFRAEPYVTLDTLFAQAAAVVRVFGWVSTKMAERDSTLPATRARVWQNLFPWPKMPVEDRATPIAEDFTVAADVIAWLMAEFVAKPVDKRTDFERNVVAVIERADAPLPVVRARNLNFLIWAIDGYKREMARRADVAQRARVTATSEFVGAIGARVDMNLTLRFRKVFGSEFGPRAMCLFNDQAGNVVIWWGTSDAAFDMILDEVYLVKGTVKAHTIYEDVRRTELTRVKVLEGAMKEAA